MHTIKEFLSELKHQKNTLTVSNPYLVEGVIENLEAYFETMLNISGKRILLVGEAPGYKGCGVTGIPFTSGDVFEKVDHPVLSEIKEKLTLRKIEPENTATIVWTYLATKNNTPLFWNSFPFHPHPKDNKSENRAPNMQEVIYGVRFLRALNVIFKPDLILAIGRKGEKGAKLAFPGVKIKYIRHPSMGGKPEFVKGMDAIL